MENKHLILTVMPDLYAVSQLKPGDPIPSWATVGEFWHVTHGDDELSVVAPQKQTPADIKSERDWRCLKLVGPLDLTLVGILASLSKPLAEAGISIFSISTFNTDYILVKQSDLENAIQALAGAGFSIIR